MSIFSQSFFSVGGQVERFKNVGQTLVAAVVPEKVQKAILPKSLQVGSVQANTSNRIVNKVLETGANHPFIAAGIGAAATHPALALAAGKEVVGKTAKGIKAVGQKLTGGAQKAVKVVPTVAAAKTILPNRAPVMATGTVGALSVPVSNSKNLLSASQPTPTLAAPIAVDPLYTTGNAQTAMQVQQLYDQQLQVQTLGGESPNEFLKQTIGQVGGGSPSTNVGGGMGAFPSAPIRRRKVSKKRIHRVKAFRKKRRVSKHKRQRAKSKGRGKRIHYTKNGQPYVLMRSGKARFITRRGAKLAKKLKGGMR